MYCCATRLRTLCPASAPHQPCQVSSLSERKAKKLIREAGRTSGVWGPAGSWWGVSCSWSGKEIESALWAVKRQEDPREGQGMSAQHMPRTGLGMPEGEAQGGGRLLSAFPGSSAQYWGQTPLGSYDAG